MQTSKKRVIIIGAGIAGLAAAAHLTQHNYEVKILEARHYYGGRICTDNSLGIPIGRGASWVHGNIGNPISELANATSAKMVAVKPDKYVFFDGNSKPIPESIIKKFDEKFQLHVNQSKELAFSVKDDISLSAALAHVIKRADLSAIELVLLESKLASLESYMGASSESLSARHWDQEEPWPGENCFMTSSYQSIIDNLASQSTIILNTIVKGINKRSSDVEILTNNITYYADNIIVTVPLGVLKKNTIVFNPPLPEKKKQAIERLEMGLFNIIAMKFPKVFWPKESHAMFFSHFDKTSIPVFFNLHHFVTQQILLGFSGGSRALTLEGLSDEKVIEIIMSNFYKIFGKLIPEPESFFITRWSCDAFSYGSYSYLPPGASSADYEELGQPINDWLFFAGEATSSKHPATTHGAYLSGIREAERILSHG